MQIAQDQNRLVNAIIVLQTLMNDFIFWCLSFSIHTFDNNHTLLSLVLTGYFRSNQPRPSNQYCILIDSIYRVHSHPQCCLMEIIN